MHKTVKLSWEDRHQLGVPRLFDVQQVDGCVHIYIYTVLLADWSLASHAYTGTLLLSCNI